jgi:uncharacterized protein (DUF885 family)
MRTGFSKRRVHQYCFNFLRNPGYANCYAIPGMILASMQDKAQNRGHSRKKFNTTVSSMGFYPWTISERQIHLNFYPTQ